jgi:serine/threonine-protein phosphatase 2B catalytic subunit
MLRGNHESRGLTDHFTFREEVLDKFDDEVYEAIMLCFDALPLIAIVNQTYLCMHGGVSPMLRSLEEVN